MRTLAACSFAFVALVACGSAQSVEAPEPNGNDGGARAASSDASSAGAPSASNGDDDAQTVSTSTFDASGDAEPSANDAGDDGADSSLADAGPLGRYDEDGPIAATDFDETVTGSGSSYSVHVYLPSSSGPHPVVLIAAGLEQSGVAYAPYAKRLASWGIAAITRDDPGLTSKAASVATDLDYVVTTWLAAENAKTTSKLSGAFDLGKIALAGHSKGGQAVLLAAEGTAKGKIRGVFGIDPVDSDSLARAALPAIGVPVAFIGETTDGASSGCAPSADNFLTLYGDAASPAVAITAVDADHTMFEDADNCSFCSLCTAGTADQPTVLAYSVRYATAFFARELLGDSSVGPAFSGAGASVDTSAKRVAIVSK